ncbi:MAG: class C sortase [Clostridia bacterium]|nr:class C sortase [Clostridia bacterium]
MKKKNKWSTFILLLFFFIGLSVMLYPAISSYWNSKTQSEAIVDYEQILQNIPQEDYTSVFDAAHDYNKQLASLAFPLLEHTTLNGYNEILNLSGNGMMGYLTIDKIALELPVYHGTSNDVLSHAVGHLEGTSFPVGEPGTHAVVSAHRGLPSATLFTNLDHLELGDYFYFTILDRTITYQVDQIKTVDPSNSQDLIIDPEQEYCTLLTCTPYGINTHRLLVRGVKTDSTQQKTIYITSDAYQIDSLIVTPIVALPMLFTLMMIVLFKPVKKDDLGDDL